MFEFPRQGTGGGRENNKGRKHDKRMMEVQDEIGEVTGRIMVDLLVYQ